METNETLIYSMDYSKPAIDEYKEFLGICGITDDPVFKEHPKPESKKQSQISNDMPLAMLNEIEYVPDIRRVKKAEEFISQAKRFSRLYKVSAEIYRMKSMISVYLYFGVELPDKNRKSALCRLIDAADEISAIPWPNGKDGWYNNALVLNYMTHHSYLHGRELHPF